MPRNHDRSLPLLREIRACRLCEDHLPYEPRPVLAASASARILIIGQAPGRIAHHTRTPWNDASGRRLRQWLELSDKQFYDRALIALVPMGFCYPGSTRSGDVPPRPECARHWHPRLFAKLKRAELTILVGRYAFDRYLATEARSLTEGVRLAPRLLPARILLPHPSPRNQMWLRNNPWFESSVLPLLRRRVRRIVEGD